MTGNDKPGGAAINRLPWGCYMPLIGEPKLDGDVFLAITVHDKQRPRRVEHTPFPPVCSTIDAAAPGMIFMIEPDAIAD